MFKSTIVLIMSGGGGQRLWPLSQGKNTKPFLKFPKNISLLEQAYHRARSITKPEYIFVVTHQKLALKTKTILKGLPKTNLILEPQSKNTAPAILYALLEIENKLKQNFPVLVLPADHYIPSHKEFKICVKLAIKRIREKNVLMTFGLKVQEPKTEYGYIEVGQRLNQTFQVKRFIEKPNLQTAQKFMIEKNYFWNSGIFCWSSDYFFQLIRKLEEKMYKDLVRALHEKKKSTLAVVYQKLPNLSIDYGLMEKAPDIEMVASDFTWSDLGHWDSVAQSLSLRPMDNVILGPSTIIDGNRNFVYSNKRIVGFGIDNLVIVESKDYVLVTTRSKAPYLKDLLKEL